MLERISSKQLGIVILLTSILIGSTFIYSYIHKMGLEEKACEAACGGHENGVCPMEKTFFEEISYLFTSSLIIVLGIIGSMLIFSKKESFIFGSENKFGIILSVLNDNEKKVLKAVREQEGIKQSTLKYRVDFSKSKLTKVLKGLIEKNLVRREESGKTYKVFLTKNLS